MTIQKISNWSGFTS